MTKLRATSKGKTHWYPRGINPVRHGYYECGVKITGAQRHLFRWMLEWDGIGFIVPVPMVVFKWRGLTKDATTRKAQRNKEVSRPSL